MAGIDEYTKLLLHCNGADSSTSFPDSSDSNHSVTANGNAQVDTAQSKFGGASGLFDGTGDYLSVPDHADWTFGSGDFTIDFWLRRNANGATYLLGQSHTDYSAGSRAWEMNLDASDKLQSVVWVSGANPENQGTTLSNAITADNTWHHLAMVRYGNTLTQYIDGIADGTKDITGMSVQDSAYPLYICSLSGLSPINGWIDEFRVSKGIARWTANFTPPTNAYSRAAAGGFSGFSPWIF